MEPLSTAVASVVTKFVVDTGTTIAQKLGSKAAEAARNLANTVLDKLGEDPAEARTVERYRDNPTAMQPAVEAALKELVERDKAFAAQIQTLLVDYDEAEAAAIQIEHVEGSVQIGDHNILFDRTSGDTTVNQ